MPSSHTKLFMAAAVLCLMSNGLLSCAGQNSALPGDTRDYAALSGKLAKDMTEKGVADALAATPDKADLTTCTDHAGKDGNAAPGSSPAASQRPICAWCSIRPTTARGTSPPGMFFSSATLEINSAR